MSGRSSIRLQWRKSFFFSFLILLAALLTIAGCGSSTTERPTYDVVTGPVTTKAKDPVSQDAVEKIVTRKLGDAGIAGQPVIRTITLTPEAGGVFADIQLNRTSSCHPGQLVGTAISMSQDVMSAIFRYPDVGRVQLTVFGTTEMPEDKDKPAARIMLTKAATANLDWFQFTNATVEKLSTEFWVEPNIYANWKQYGGAAITDEAQKAAANEASAAATTPTTP